MLTDEHPRFDHDDDYIRKWAMDHGFDYLPIVYVPLWGSVYEGANNIAVIHWDKPGFPVVRRREIE